MRTAFAAMLMLCTGCALFTEPLEPPIGLSIDRSEYTARVTSGEGILRSYAFTIVAQFANGSRDTVFLDRCGTDGPTPIYEIVMVDGRESAFGPAWGCGASRPIPVAPGQVRVDTLQIRGPWGRNGFTNEPMGAFDGRMVLFYNGYSCQRENECTPLRRSLSASFRVTTPP